MTISVYVGLYRPVTPIEGKSGNLANELATALVLACDWSNFSDLSHLVRGSLKNTLSDLSHPVRAGLENSTNHRPAPGNSIAAPGNSIGARGKRPNEKE